MLLVVKNIPVSTWPWKRKKNATSTRASLTSTDPPRRLSSFLVTCSPGLESVTAVELGAASIQAKDIRIEEGGVHFRGDWKVGLNAVLWVRCGTRILHLLSSAEISWQEHEDPLYRFVKSSLNWSRFMRKKDGGVRTFSVHSTVRDCTRKSTCLYASKRAQVAICDFVRESGLNTPEYVSPSTTARADLPLFLMIEKDNARLYRDMSGLGLELRGYRDMVVEEGLSGGTAAGILSIAGWNRIFLRYGGEYNKNIGGSNVLLDPMCGCGTLLIEAALMASNIAPGLLSKHWPFMSWHDFDEQAWEDCCREASSAAVKLPPDVKLLGNDKSKIALSLCAMDAERAGVRHLLQLSCKDCNDDYVPSARPSLVTVNPPWGSPRQLLGREKPRLLSTYSGLGRFLKRCCVGSDVYMLSSSKNLASQLRLKPDLRRPITIKGLNDFMLLHYYVKSSEEKAQKKVLVKTAGSY